MPTLSFTLPKGSIQADVLAGLAPRLAAALHKWEKAPDNELFRSLAWVHVHELDPAAVYDVEGQATKPQFLVEATVPADALKDEAVAGLTKEITALIAEAANLPEEDLVRIWVLVSTIDEGKWGAGGNVIRFKELRALLRSQRADAASH